MSKTQQRKFTLVEDKMSETKTDLIAVLDDYVDVFSESGFTNGDRLLIQNKSEYKLWIVEKSTKPILAESMNDGLILPPFDVAYVTSDSLNIWVRGKGNFFVQEIT